VWRGGHLQAADHLEAARPEGRSAATQLRRLLGLKTAAQYDPAPIGNRDAQSALRHAERLVEAASSVVTAASP